eukprot:CAMPEP_0119086442 /NCGR_PEP_ID=MMETSP1178-20130426/137982_1 /TAXON_ID=33656 /ORGANISM="unid sp, Strain CCMP2000" /LENGTH=348 /DNA_ID=CAMNT_0007069581 /DNA_START=73 /DNA_END=1115 /DNA_ORIENTATION=+
MAEPRTVCKRPMCEGNEISCLPIHVLNTELRCPICLNLLRHPVATECMHRFCASCIEKCLRLGKKECPTCRQPIATRRNLRNDTNFMALITKLYPDLEDFEEEEDRIISNVASMARMVAITAGRQQEMIENHQRNNPPPPPPPQCYRTARATAAATQPRPRRSGGGQDIYGSEGMDESGTEEGGSSESFEEEDDELIEESEGEDEDSSGEVHRPPYAAPRRSHKKQGRASNAAGRSQRGRSEQTIQRPRRTEVNFLLLRHPLEKFLPSLQRDYITVTVEAQIHQLQKFLALKLGVPDWSAFQVSTQLPNKQYHELRPDWSLCTVISAHHLDADRLELHWRYSSEAASR